ncbi:CGNR zinc finger domain-containing protein [Nonomuraea sp. SYSU D8015]|uniref:CGNR zinc finger domain-containing protein n=1 Tax=Nonomuraea sp. SYSU D8015 TaxID=2593644 RepID=UPI001CB6D6C4|nr:CGNR zinc finger domain-containing protein [Nonomuraea sp. SYSU D8015]
MDVSELPLVGGHPALDLVNTVERGVPAPGWEPRDYVSEPAALLLWARRAGMIDEAEARAVTEAWDHDPGAAHAALEATREIRESLHLALLATAALAPEPIDAASCGAALDRLHCRWLAAAGRSTLAPDPRGASAVRLVVGVVPASLVPDRAVDAALDLLRTADVERVRRCPTESGGCGWVFLDRSRNGSRRWCRMADCGTDVKARRLTERRRAARRATADTGTSG